MTNSAPIQIVTGMRIGALIVGRSVRNYANKLGFTVHCDCGKPSFYLTGNLINAINRKSNASCGCMKYKTLHDSIRTHGLSKTKLYGVYHGMLARCRDNTRWDWEYYGGRGITVCDRWKASFLSFKVDMEAGYREGLELDRVECDGNYEKDNCRWITRKQQMNNLRYNTYAKLTVEDLL